MNCTAPLALFAILAAAAPLAAQATGKPEEPVPLTIDSILVKAAELPTTIKFVEGMPCASRQPRSYFETPDPEKLMGGQSVPAVLRSIFPKPKHKKCQSFAAEKGAAGSVFLFEYAEADIDNARAFLPAYLWGGRGRSQAHPEELIVHGNLAWILSFPRGDPAAEWYKERLRKKFRVPAVRERPEFLSIGRQLSAAYDAEDADKGIQVLQENAKVTNGWGFGQYLLGEFGVMKGDWPTAERGYRRALELHGSLEDPLDANIFWASHDGLGMALLFQRKLNEAATVLARAKELAPIDGIREGAGSAYNLACAYALLKRWPDALAALKDAIAGHPEYRAHARTDEDLVEARKRKEFQELLKEPPAPK
jgi:tetratricopeptide (TPR) repeat protein